MNPLPDTKETIVSRAQSYFDEGYACSQSVLMAWSDHFNLDISTARLISSTFGGGMGRLRMTCGAVTGAFMVLGLAYGNEDPKDMDTKLNGYVKVRELYHKVEALHGTVNCKELIQQYATQWEIEKRKHHKLVCRQIVGEVSGLLYEQINKSIED